MLRRLGFRARGAVVAGALVGWIIAACGFGVDTDGLFGGSNAGGDGGEAGLDGAAAVDGTIPKVQVAQIAAGDEFACGRRIDGTVMCWGRSDNGRLGDGRDTPSSLPVLVRDVNDAIDLSIGDDHACIVKKDNTVACWGRNSNRQIGDGSKEDAKTPRPVLELSDVTQVAAGGEFTCALGKDGAVRCWGGNDRGQLGDNTTSPRSNPAPVQGVADATQVVATYGSACALVKSGDVYCWGANDQGEVGNGAAPTDAHTAVKVGGISGVVALGHGAVADHVCAVLGDGTARCWGNADSGQIGEAKGEDFVKVPTNVVALNDAEKITMGAGFTCAVRHGAKVSCWGTNGWRQLGLGDSQPPDGTSSPVSIDALSDVQQIVGGDDFACALFNGGERISCWGSNRTGSLGRNTRMASEVPLKVDGVTATSLALGDEHSCVTSPQGALVCWGMNEYRQQADKSFQATGKPTPIAAISGAQQAAGGEIHTCGLFGTDVKCWGHGSEGELGNGQTNYIQTDPVAFQAGGPVSAIGAGYHYTCALLSTNQITCAGLDDDGRVARSGGGEFPTPGIVMVPVAPPDAGVADAGDDGGDAGPPPPTSAPLSNVSKIGIGRLHSCAIHDGGNVACWGTGWDGQLGVGTKPRSTPMDVPLGMPATDVAAGGDHTCAILQDGSVRCWGGNYAGQLSGGGGSGPDLRTPNLGGKQAKSITAGASHTCVVYTDGTAACWGSGDHGQLGNGVRSDETQPVAVSALTGVKAIAARSDRTCAITGDGSVYCWGDDAHGELGDGVLMVTGVPAPVYGY